QGVVEPDVAPCAPLSTDTGFCSGCLHDGSVQHGEPQFCASLGVPLDPRLDGSGGGPASVRDAARGNALGGPLSCHRGATGSSASPGRVSWTVPVRVLGNHPPGASAPVAD